MADAPTSRPAQPGVAPATPATIALVLRGGGPVEVIDIGAVRAVLDDPSAIVWVDIVGEQTPESSALLRETLGLHSLVVEDMFIDYSVPKIEELDGALYILLHAVRPTVDVVDVELDELDILLGPR